MEDVKKLALGASLSQSPGKKAHFKLCKVFHPMKSSVVGECRRHFQRQRIGLARFNQRSAARRIEAPWIAEVAAPRVNECSHPASKDSRSDELDLR